MRESYLSHCAPALFILRAAALRSLSLAVASMSERALCVRNDLVYEVVVAVARREAWYANRMCGSIVAPLSELSNCADLC